MYKIVSKTSSLSGESSKSYDNEYVGDVIKFLAACGRCVALEGSGTPVPFEVTTVFLSITRERYDFVMDTVAILNATRLIKILYGHNTLFLCHNVSNRSLETTHVIDNDV